MLNIAICDDDKILCNQLEDMLTNISMDINQKIETEVYYSGEELYKFLEKGIHYDLIFLDIELCQLNGVAVGKKIREDLKNDLTHIVYISSKENYAMELFDVRPLNFIIKPLNKDKIKSVLQKAVTLLDKSQHFFEYKNSNITFSLPVCDILYFESHTRKVNIVLKNEIRNFYGKLSDVEEQLNNQDFIQIHKSFLINYNYVIEYTYEYVKMSNHQVLIISQGNRKTVREKLMQRKQRMRHD